jgi:hypothetical protein
VLGVAPIILEVGAGETDTPGELFIIGTDADGLALIGLRPGVKPGLSPLFGFVLGTVAPFGAVVVGCLVPLLGAVWPVPDVFPD